MGMTNDNLCNSCTNIGCEFQSGIIRTKCAFYMPPHIESDNCGNYLVMQPTVEAIPKDQYEARLKADLEAILVELQLEIEEIEVAKENTEIRAGECCMKGACIDLIQQKINALRGSEDAR